MNIQNILQGFGQATVTTRPRRLRSVGRTRQQEGLKQLSLAVLKLLPFVVLLNIALALAIDRVDTRIAQQQQQLHDKKLEKQFADSEYKRAYGSKSIVQLAGKRLGMVPALPEQHGYYDKRTNRFDFN